MIGTKRPGRVDVRPGADSARSWALADLALNRKNSS
jgi:hypothetical protein